MGTYCTVISTKVARGSYVRGFHTLGTQWREQTRLTITQGAEHLVKSAFIWFCIGNVIILQLLDGSAFTLLTVLYAPSILGREKAVQDWVRVSLIFVKWPLTADLSPETFFFWALILSHHAAHNVNYTEFATSTGTLVLRGSIDTDCACLIQSGGKASNKLKIVAWVEINKVRARNH